MGYHFRKATRQDVDLIWTILDQAIQRRKDDGSKQWQDGYPNRDVVLADVDGGVGYVLEDNGEVLGYCAVIINDEPEYARLHGEWITDDDFVVVHRVAIAGGHLGKGLSQTMLQQVEHIALDQGIKSIKVDTNFDNIAMLRIFEKLGYLYCGEVYFRGSARRAFEKVLKR